MLPARTQIAALLAFVGMVIFAFGYTLGPFHLSQSEIAERVTAACVPLEGTVAHTDPADITERELSLAGTRAQNASFAVAAILPDAPRGTRAQLRGISRALADAAPGLQSSRIAEGATLLGFAQTGAARLGASCPVAVTVTQGAGVDAILQARLTEQRKKAKADGTAPQLPSSGGTTTTEGFVSP